MHHLVACLVVLVLALAAWAEMPSDASVKAVADGWLAKRPAPRPGTVTRAEAVKVHERFQALIAPDVGRVVGYKAALTNAAVHKQFGYDRPVRGALYEKMILRGPAPIPATLGVRPIFRADLVGVVGDAAKVVAARTAQVKCDASCLVASKVVARLGVVAVPVHLPATAEERHSVEWLRESVVDSARPFGRSLLGSHCPG